MRIAYITINIDPKIINGGVGRKIESQVSLWKSTGHSVKLFVLTSKLISLPDARQFVFNTSPIFILPRGIVREMSRSITLMRLISEVGKYRPDVIYFRFGLFTFPLQNLFKIAPVVLEVNSNDLDEYRSRGIFFYWLNRLTRDFIFSHCAGWVASSHELANLEANRRHRRPVCVVSNGIDLEKYEPLPLPKNQTPSLTMVGSPGMNWHGTDKLLLLAERLPEMNFNIVGYRREDFPGNVPPNVRLHGYLESDGVKRILAETDVVFGTLALHRKSMREASPLKVREALAYGIPVIIAYQDTDLSDLKSDLFLFLPNTEDNAASHAEAIGNFAYKSMGKRVDRELIFPLINQRQKEEKRLEFFSAIIKSAGRQH
jgi:glycosyltransferase involved in cell wall biosynthesis